MTTADEAPIETFNDGSTLRIPLSVLGVLLIVAAMLTFAMLMTRQPTDPSLWNASDAPVRNLLGPLGANLSAAMIATLGYASYLLPAGFAVWAWRCLARRVPMRATLPARILLGGLFALVTASAFLSAMPGVIADAGTGLGGVIGDRTIRPFARLFEGWEFSSPFQVPGLAMLALSAAQFAVAVGVTRHEIGAFIGLLDLRKARDSTRGIGEGTLARTRNLTSRLRKPDFAARSNAVAAGPTPSRPKLAPLDPVAPTTRKKSKRKTKAHEAPPRDRDYAGPALDLMSSPRSNARRLGDDELATESARLLHVLNDYGVDGEIVGARQGPVVTQHQLDPTPGTKAARVVAIADDVARSMSALSARISPIKGRTVIGIELPNEQRETVYLQEIMREVVGSRLPLPLALGKKIDGEIEIASLTRMPHLLVAGTTGSGKSVSLNAMILSLLYRHSPDECRMIMIDPKMLELSVYDGIPHLLSPVVTDPRKAVMALKWVVKEMEGRYQKMAKMNVRGIDGYNAKMREAIAEGRMIEKEVQTGFDAQDLPLFEMRQEAPETLPYIVVVVDEMADLMMVAGKEIEACIQRLAQMARASGIHLIMATQRPSVDVITGTIKANFPTRISFQVTSKIDSRTILGEQGAEQLLGMGDMLFMAGGGRITRVHGPFVTDDEVQDIANYLRSLGPPDGDFVDFDEAENDSAIDEVLGLGSGSSGDDALYDQAVAIVAKDRRATTSYIQRRLQIGYNRAARIMEEMEEQGVISAPNTQGKREILIETR